MSSLITTSAAPNTGQDRRCQTRRRLEELVYADFGRSNGGIILDISEGGLAIQSVEPLEKRTTFGVRFKLPGVGTPIEAMAEAAWVFDSGKRGGLRFLALTESVRREIKKWAAPEIRNQPSADIQKEFTQADPPVSGHLRQRAAQPAEPATTAIDDKIVPSTSGSREARLPAARDTPYPSSPPGSVAALARNPLPAPNSKTSARGVVIGGQSRRALPELLEDAPVAEAARRDSDVNRAATNPIIPVKPQNSQAASASAPVKSGLEPWNSSPSQILNLALAAAFVATTLAVIAAFPTLRTHFPSVQNNASQIADTPPIGPSDFHVEVDHDGHRLILTDGETSAVPTTNMSSRRDEQAADSLRNGAPKQPAAGAEANAKIHLNEVPELVLKKPRREATGDARAADSRLPSIFDGVAPPIPVFDAGAQVPAPEKPVQPQPSPSPHLSDLQAATLIYRVAPLYPVVARQQHLQGEVRVRATVGKDGVLRSLKPLSGDSRLIPAALSALGQWRYKPATLNGQAIESEVIVTTAFELK